MNKLISEGVILKRRIIFLSIVTVVVFFILIGNLFYLQVVRGLEFQTRAKDVALREINIPAQRGEIFDSKYSRALVSSKEGFAIDIIPGKVPIEEFPLLFENLSKVLKIDIEQLQRKVPVKMRHLFQPIEVKSGVEFKTIATIAEHINKYPGVTWHSEPTRDYQKLGSLSHVVGYVGDITREELQALFNDGYVLGSTLGKSGVEKSYDKVLRGVDGKRIRTVDVNEREVSNLGRTLIPPQPGSDVVLTIDKTVQKAAEIALGNRVGSIVVINASSGAVLAMVSYPWFDPETFTGDRGALNFKVLALDPSFPFINRAIQSSYPPASTFKILMSTALFEEKTFSINHTIDCKGFMQYGDRIFNDWIEEGHGIINLKDALAQSCDIFYYEAGKLLGIDSIIKYAYALGLGRLSGIDLPGESAGFVPSPDWKQATLNTPWVGGDTVNISIGQGFITVTPLQLANMVSMIANEGVIFRPHVVKEIRDSATGELLKVTKSEPILKSEFGEETFAFVQDSMRGVITQGTAEVVLTTDAVSVAGKTGTSETGIEEQYHSWFVAYGPYDDTDVRDKIIIVVMVEAVNEWEWWAPKAANLLFQSIFAYQDMIEVLNYLNPWYRTGVTLD